ncbi:MAG: DUF3540 domain-containing protein [Sandaracinaceae bacterium]|nr:DUF3540 domain-containing protein [Sandaracinaceae bacterium]
MQDATHGLSLYGLGGLCVARVEAARGAALEVSGPAFGRAAARLAVAGGYAPEAGDAVLVGRADDGGLYVVGVVRALREASAPAVRAADGTTAALERDGEQEVLRMRDAEGHLLVEHRPSEGRTLIAAPGDLALFAEGDLALDARGAVRVRAGTDLSLDGGGDVRLAARDLDGEEGSSLSLRGGVAALAARRLGAKLGRADAQLDEANLVVGTLRTVAKRVKQQLGALETVAERVVERTKESFRETEGLSQTRAGRLRLVATEALTAIGQTALLKATEGVKIKGDKIYLA